MCRATVGASPVCLCTCAASEIFSYGSRAVPEVPNTLKRVPELPNAQLGSSIACSASWSRMDVKSVNVLRLSCRVMVRVLDRCELVLEMEVLLERRHDRVG